MLLSVFQKVNPDFSVHMLNDAFLGLSVIAVALVVWLIRLLITDLKGVVRDSLRKQAEDF